MNCEHGIIVLPPDAIGIEFKYAGINTESVPGKQLDLSQITKHFIYPGPERKATITKFNTSDLNKFRINSVGLTDFLLKWRITKLAKVIPGAKEYDTLFFAQDGTTRKLHDMSQIFYVYFTQIDSIDSLVAELKLIKGIIWAEKDPLAHNE